MVKFKKIFIILAFLVCGHFMIATKNAYAVDSYSFSPVWSAWLSNNSNEDVKLTEMGCQAPSSSSCGGWNPTDTFGSYNLGRPTGKNYTRINIRRQSGNQLSIDERLDWAIVTYTVFSTNSSNYDLVFAQGGSVSNNYSNHTYYEPVYVLSNDKGQQLDVSGGNEAGANQSITVLYRILPSTKNRTGDTILLQQLYFPSGSGTDTWFNVKSVVMVDDYTSLLNELNGHSYNIEQLLQKISDDSAGEQMKEDKQDQQQQGQDSQETQQDTQNSVDGSTQSLLSVIGDFFGAFTSARPSNCNFNWGLAQYGFGSINMCQTPIPSEFSAIFNILSIIIIIPMIMWLISSIINAFKEFQQ